MSKQNGTKWLSFFVLIACGLLILSIGLIANNLKANKVKDEERKETNESGNEASSRLTNNITIVTLNGKCYLKVLTNLKSLECTPENLPEHIYISNEYTKDNSSTDALIKTNTISKFIHIDNKLYIYTRTNYYDDLTEIHSDEVQGIVNKILDRNEWYQIDTEKIFLGEMIE